MTSIIYGLFFGGRVQPPAAVGNFNAVDAGGPGQLVQLLLNILILIGGLYALFNFLLAGYAFLSAGDNPKGVEQAWAKIYQSIIGLVFLVGSFVIAGVIGIIIYGRADALLNPVLILP
jgi:hypothetical protein